MHDRAVPLALLLASLLALGGCAPAPAPSGEGEAPRGRGGRGVLVLAIDGLRADHVGLLGYDRDTTPELDARIGARGVAFSQVFSASPEMIPAHAALLTGCDPELVHQPLPPGDVAPFAPERRSLLPGSTPSLAEEFLVAGYATACFVDHAWLDPDVGLFRGFERYDEFTGGVELDDEDLGAAGLGRRVLNWVRSLGADRDWFAYVQVNDLERGLRHAGDGLASRFEPRPELGEVPPVVEARRAFFAVPRALWPGGQRTLGEYEAAYDELLRRLDEKLGRLFARFDALGLEELTVCVVGTYGMGFGESGLVLDHGTLSDVDLHVPLLLSLPASSPLPRGSRTSSLTSTIDVAPTVLEVAGLPAPAWMHGRSQVPALAGPSAPPVREACFSSGGVSAGFAVHDARYSYQSVVQAIRGDAALRRSWYGTPDPPRRESRRHLRDRRAGSGPGDLEPSATDAARATELHALGQDWYAWIEEARTHLHDPPWRPEPTAPEVLEELRRRGLIGP